ncbi:MAG: alcohol dehydrogenase catalytic domain-containing protein [Sedimentisphaerales bacterium]|nr:alcohol dehydrogenase catalytic domain-containing protein [Sedimentisphaerales bacterium]
MTKTMKSMRLTGIRQMEICEVDRPELTAETDVLLKLELVGVCGSDVHYYSSGRIGSQVVEYPFRVGHECSATVVAVGSKVTRVKVGESVAVDPAMPCYECDQCRVGRENTCRKLKFLGCPGQIEGCLSEFMVMPERSVFPLGGKVSLVQAMLSEPLSIGVYAVKQSLVDANAQIAVLGSGPIGLSVLVAAQAVAGVKEMYATDKIAERVDLAGKAGAKWAGNPLKEDVVEAILGQSALGMDAVFECSGDQDAIDQALELLRPGGKLMLIGIPTEPRISFMIDKLRRKELSVINVRRQNGCVEPTLEMLASGKADVDFMVTHRFKLEQTKEAFDLVADYRDGVIKAVIEF